MGLPFRDFRRWHAAVIHGMASLFWRPPGYGQPLTEQESLEMAFILWDALVERGFDLEALGARLIPHLRRAQCDIYEGAYRVGKAIVRMTVYGESPYVIYVSFDMDLYTDSRIVLFPIQRARPVLLERDVCEIPDVDDDPDAYAWVHGVFYLPEEQSAFVDPYPIETVLDGDTFPEGLLVASPANDEGTAFNLWRLGFADWVLDPSDGIPDLSVLDPRRPGHA